MTRVTQSMLSNNLLRNLNTSYGKMSKLQDQINSGKKIGRASDDPVVAVKGMQFRTQLDKIEQFNRNVNEAHGWLDTTDEALGQVGDALNRVKELVVQAANDTNTADDRAKIKAEIDQIQQQIQDVSNTQLGSRYIFSGTNTQQATFKEVEHYSLEAVEKYFNGLSAADKLTFATNYDPNDLKNITPPLERTTTRILNSEYVNEDGDVVNPLAQKTALTVVISDNTVEADNTTGLPVTDKPQVVTSLPDANGIITTTTTMVTADKVTTQTVLSKNIGLLSDAEMMPAVHSGNESIKMEVFDGVQLNLNTPGAKVFGEIDEMMSKISSILDPANGKGHEEIQALLGGVVDLKDPNAKSTLSTLQGTVLSARADIGARQNRLEVIENRLAIAEVNTTKQMSVNEDTDYAKAITEMTSAEAIHQSSLSVGAKIIQQTLVDFLR